MTPIRETIARAISPYYWAAAGTARDTRAKKVHRDRSLFAADRVLRALDEAGLAVVPREPTEAMQVAGAAISHDLSGQIGHPTDKHPVTAETYRAMISAFVVE